MIKKIIVFLIILSSLCFGLVFISACNEPNLVFALNNDGTYTVTGKIPEQNIISGEKINIKRIVIPRLHKGKPVTEIGDFAFFEWQSLNSITIPDSITSIGFAAFSYCSSLQSITIPLI